MFKGDKKGTVGLKALADRALLKVKATLDKKKLVDTSTQIYTR